MLATAAALVVLSAASVGSLLTAKGKRGPDRAAQAAAVEQERVAETIATCQKRAKELSLEVRVMLDVTTVSGLLPAASASSGPVDPRAKPKKPQELAAPAWQVAKPSHERATLLAGCEEAATALITPNEEAASGWKGIANAAAVVPPGATPEAQLEAVRKIQSALEKAPLDAVQLHVSLASDLAKKAATTANERAKTAQIELPLPKGVLGRTGAIAVGVVISLVALLVHFFSLRSAVARRAVALHALRRATASPDRGLQAATILRIACEPHAGEPGLALGASLGGLIVALAVRTDADWYVAGVILGLLFGLIGQLLARSSYDPAPKFRERALQLAELEKPTIPVVLVLGAVQPGMERQFLDYFLRLNPSDAGTAVERLAEQAEEQILIAADAQAAQAAPFGS
jgi:hypothetical protein